jgi:hypothetical protein
MFRLIKLLMALLVLILIVVTGVVVAVTTVEDPLTFTILSQKPATGGGTTLECEVKNTSLFPIEFVPASFTLLPAEDASAAFLAEADKAAAGVRLKPGATAKSNLLGPGPPNPADVHTFSYDWNVWGQESSRGFLRWLDENATFIPDSWLSSLFWQTEPRKGRVKSVPMPGQVTAEKKPDSSPAPAPAKPLP